MSLLLGAYQSSLETKDGEKLWYPRVVKFGDVVTTKEIGIALAGMSSLSAGDARSMVENMTSIIGKSLLDGKSVCLEDFGTFTVTCKAVGTGVKTKEEVNPNQITHLKVRFTPAYKRSSFQGTTRAIFNGVSFKMIDDRLKENTSAPGGNDDDDYVDPNA